MPIPLSDAIVQTMFNKKDLERRCVNFVAQARGCLGEDVTGACDWPDGWIVDGGKVRIAAEVVSAFPEMDASAWARAWKTASDEADQIDERTGVKPSWVVCDGEGIVLRAGTEIPVSTHPCDPIAGVFSAIDHKAQRYGPNEASGAILIIHHVHSPFPLEPNYLERLGDYARRTAVPFREIWIVNEYGDPAQQVPFTTTPANQ